MSDHHLGGSDNTEGTWMPDVWESLIGRYDLRSVIDVGCGRGVNTQWFHRRGLYAVGVEGFKEYIEESSMPHERLVEHDYTEEPFAPVSAFDLAWCSEFVEHVPERFIANFAATFCRCKYLCLTHATPGQGGHHHVNEQPTDYWVTRLAGYGFEHVAEETERLRATGPNTAYGRRTLTFFKNTFPVVPEAKEELRYRYRLGPESIVLDCGGYEGNFARFIAEMYQSHVYVCEPVPQFYEKITALKIPGATVFPFGVSDRCEIKEFGIQNDSSGEFAESETRCQVKLEPIAKVLHAIHKIENSCAIGLLKLNIEGGEYAVLESLTSSGLIKHVLNLQVQWHGHGPLFGWKETIPSVKEWRRRLSSKLLETHRITWETPWVWENWENLEIL